RPPEKAPEKPPEPVYLQPPRHVFALRPTPFTGDRRTVSLPGTVTDLAVGGGGRFVLLQMDGPPRLAVFDVHAGTLVRHLPLPEPGVRIAAGMDCFLVAVPSAQRLERWSLATFTREAAYPLPGPVGALCMGSASSGPLVIEPPP